MPDIKRFFRFVKEIIYRLIDPVALWLKRKRRQSFKTNYSS
jgi:hypothetical protein